MKCHYSFWEVSFSPLIPQDGWNQNHFITPVSTLERDRFKSHPSLSTTNQQMSPIIQSGQWVNSAFLVRTFVWQILFLAQIRSNISWLSLSYSNNPCSSSLWEPRATVSNKLTLGMNPFILKVYANLHQPQCIQVSQGPPSQLLPQDSASLGLWRGGPAITFDKLPRGCRWRRARSTVWEPHMCAWKWLLCLPAGCKFGISSKVILSFLGENSFIRGPLDRILIRTAWESYDLLLHLPHQLSLHPLAAFQTPSLHD